MRRQNNMLKIDYLPMCCSIMPFGEFGGTLAADHKATNDYKNQPLTLIEDINKVIDYGKERGQAAVICTTNNEQEHINEVLHQMGFKRTPFMSKRMHPNTSVALWWYQLNQ